MKLGRGQRWLLGLLGACLAAIAIYYGICCLVVSHITQTERRPFTQTPASYGLAYENIHFKTQHAPLQLSGWLIPSPGSQRVIVMIHGKAWHRTNPEIGMLPIAVGLQKQGFNVFMFDLRGYGLSQGSRFSLGMFEQDDLEAALALLRSKGFDSPHTGILGYSMGAATALLLSPREPELGAIVSDSAFADLPELLKIQIPKASGLPTWFTPGIIQCARWIYGIRVESLQPWKAVQATSEPVMFIHGANDTLVPPSHAMHLYLSAQGHRTKDLWIIPDAAHVGAYKKQPDAYISRVGAFFKANLK